MFVPPLTHLLYALLPCGCTDVSSLSVYLFTLNYFTEHVNEHEENQKH